MSIIIFLVDGLLIFMRIYYFVLFARIILSWFMVGGAAGNEAVDSIYRVVYGLTEPLLAPLRKIIPAIDIGAGKLDLSPIVLLILLRFAENLIHNMRFQIFGGL